MAVDEASEILALALIFVVHVAGGAMLVWAMVSGDAPAWRPRGWGGGGGPDDPPSDDPPPSPGPSPRRLPLPLDDTEPSRVRLRDKTPLRDAHPRPPRRPSRSPQPARSAQRR